MHGSPRGQRIAILIDSGPPNEHACAKSQAARLKPTLEDKINYALDNIEGDFNVRKAVAFLCKVYKHFEAKGCASPKEESLVVRLLPALEQFAPEVLNAEFYVKMKRTLTDEETPAHG